MKKQIKPVVWTEKERKNASYMGRNGSGHCLGIEIFYTPGAFITLQPINSKDCLATCCIQIPVTHVNQVCTEMQGSLLDLVLTRLKDQLPRLLGMNPELDSLITAKLKEKKS
jgi:hypothetical protein